MKKTLFKVWPLLLAIFTVLMFFYPVWLNGLVPIPGDFIVGVYFPWYDYKWADFIAGVPVKNPLLADVPSLIYPVRIYAIELFKAGIIPLWNPLQFNGYPLMATFQAAALYPLNVVYLLFDPITAWSLQIMAQPFLAIIFTYMLLRHLKLSKFSSILGGIVFAFSGFNMIWLEYNVLSQVAAFMPLILLSSDKLLKKEKPFWGGVLSLALASQILAGYPQLVMYTALLSIFWFLFRLETFSLKSILVKGIRVGFFAVLGVGLSAIQFLPGMELLSLSQRINEGVTGGFGVAFLPWEHLVSIFIPDYFGHPSFRNYWGQWGSSSYASVSIYVGLVTFILANISIFLIKKNKIVRFFLFSALFSLLLSLPIPPIIAIFSSEFLGLKSAAATRILVITNLSLAILASFGFENIRNISFRNILRATYLSWIVILGVILATLAASLYMQLQISLSTQSISIFELQNLTVALRNSILPVGFLIFTTSIVLLINRFKKLENILKIVLIIILTFELFRFGWKFNPFSEREFIYPKTPILEFLEKQEKPNRISGGDVIPISMWIPYNLESFAGYDAIYPKTIAKLISVINTGNVNADPAGRAGNISNYSSRLFDLTNTKFVLALKHNERGEVKPDGKISVDFNEKKFEQVFNDRSVAVLKNKNVIERALVVSDWQIAKDPVESLRILSDEKFPLDKKIVLNEDFDDFKQSQDLDSSVEYINYTPNFSKLKVLAGNDGFLFIGDTWYPGWVALVDGQKQKIFKANYAFRAIPIKKGEHTVEMSYQPESFKLGAMIFFASLGLLIFILLMTLVKFPKFHKK